MPSREGCLNNSPLEPFARTLDFNHILHRLQRPTSPIYRSLYFALCAAQGCSIRRSSSPLPSWRALMHPAQGAGGRTWTYPQIDYSCSAFGVKVYVINLGLRLIRPSISRRHAPHGAGVCPVGLVVLCVAAWRGACRPLADTCKKHRERPSPPLCGDQGHYCRASCVTSRGALIHGSCSHGSCSGCDRM